jgi:hypothetical protein
VAKGKSEHSGIDRRRLRWPDEKDGPFSLALYFGDINGRVELVGLELWAVEPFERVFFPPGAAPRAITTEVVRDLKLGALVSDSLLELLQSNVAAKNYPFLSDELTAWGQSISADRIASLSRSVGARGRHLGPDHYREVAASYTAAFAAHRSPLAEIAERWGVNKNTAARWVHVARNKHGLLPPTTPGVVTAVPKNPKKGSPS